MKNNYSVSIVIPVFNAQVTLEKCLKSIVEIDYPSDKIEIIVVDNGSNDATVQIASQYTSTVLIEPEINVGALRNKGARIANGEIIAFTDSDCLVSRHWLKSAVKLLSEKSSLNENISPFMSLGVVTGRISIPDNATWVEKAWALNRGPEQEDKRVSWASSMNLIIWKDIFFKVCGFSDNLETFEDIDLCEKVNEAGYDIIYSEKVNITHLGEAKNLIQLFKKEYWRGKGAASVFRDRMQTIRGWRYFFQITLFGFSFVGGMVNIFFLKNYYNYFFLTGHIVLPLLRSLIVCTKNKSLSFVLIKNLFCVWYVYYCARFISFWR